MTPPPSAASSTDHKLWTRETTRAITYNFTGGGWIRSGRGAPKRTTQWTQLLVLLVWFGNSSRPAREPYSCSS